MSPKKAQLRTGEEEIRESESEQGSSSDSRERKPRERVRRRLIFRQKEMKSGRVSPKKAQLRTGEEEIRESESEHSSSSDRRR
ncbi:hypothetical protein [Cytobacillus firmus]|uniref:hypothetical protein n=1 Tax=Cytobacillus firmus TaxID=1399 RepID=UPI00216210CB|nr:hypothetical protein [Cytobacillus firmus]MCS0671761.1 hypothetical protein [Cytobacillus firmus]